MLNVVAWSNQAACRETDPDEMFVQGAAQNRVKQICNGCPVKMECLADALDNRIEFGVWGGMTERERRALLRVEDQQDRRLRHARARQAVLGGPHRDVGRRRRTC